MSDIVIFTGILDTAWEVLGALLPVLLLLPIVQWLFRPPRETLVTILRGLVLAFIGITMLLHGVHIGFIGTGRKMGEIIGSWEYKWMAIPIGAVIGFVAVRAEPAVQVLCNQVEDASAGSIRKSVILYTLAGSASVLVGIGMARMVYGLSFRWVIYIGYGIALALLQFADPIFSAIGFDSGGVATGPMVSSFVLAFGIGIATGVPGRDPVADGFGLVAMVALAPILSIMLLGQLFNREGGKRDRSEAKGSDDTE
jgi:hypothetical protein